MVEIGDGAVEVTLLLIGASAQPIGERDIGAFWFEGEKFGAAVDLLGRIRILIAVVDRVSLCRAHRKYHASANQVS